MFEPNNDDKKLDWMYKGAGSSIDREEYLLGRSIDKSLEQLNAAEKHGSDSKHPKNHVEHECIPPSIRDFQNLTSGEQVDLAQKLQEDPLVAIKKQEEETRRKLLQNPVQLKKLQNVLKMKSTKKKKKKNKKKCKKSKSDSEDIDAKLAEKYLKLKVHLNDSSGQSKSKKSDKTDLDKILGQKFKLLKSKLSQNDLDEILNMDSTSTGSSDSEDDKTSRQIKIKSKKSKRNSSSSSSNDSDDNKNKKNSHGKRSLSKLDFEKALKKKSKHNETEENKKTKSSKSKSYRKRNDSSSSDDSNDQQSKKNEVKDRTSRSERIREDYEHKKYSRSEDKKLKSRYVSTASKERAKETQKASNKTQYRRSRSASPVRKTDKNVTSSSEEESQSNEDEKKPKKVNYGLVKADGSKIPLGKNKHTKETAIKSSVEKNKDNDKKVERHKRKKMSEKEIENRRKEMLQNAEWRDHERVSNVKRYREDDTKESKTQEYNPGFLQDQLIKSANSSTVESRIKSNINHIQRSRKDMNSHFSRRY